MHHPVMIRAGSCQPLSEASSVLLAWDPLTNRDVGWLTLPNGEGQDVVTRLQYRDFTLRPEGRQGLERKISREVELKAKDFEHSSLGERNSSASHTRVGSQESPIRNVKIPRHQQEELCGSPLFWKEAKQQVNTGSSSDNNVHIWETGSPSNVKKQSFQNKTISLPDEGILKVKLQDRELEHSLIGLRSVETQQVTRSVQKDTNEGLATECDSYRKCQRAGSFSKKSSRCQEIQNRDNSNCPIFQQDDISGSPLISNADKLQNVKKLPKNILDTLRKLNLKVSVDVQGVQSSRMSKKRKQTDEELEDRMMGSKRCDQTFEPVRASHICPISLVAGRGEVMLPGRMIRITQGIEDLDSVFRAVSALRNKTVQVDYSNETVDEEAVGKFGTDVQDMDLSHDGITFKCWKCGDMVPGGLMVLHQKYNHNQNMRIWNSGS